MQPTTALELFCAADPHLTIRAMLIVAHPGDEVIGAASRLMALGPSITLVHLTDGAPRNLVDARRVGCATWHEYALVRRRELEAALRVGGIRVIGSIGIGVPDQETSYCLGEVTSLVRGLLKRHRPEMVVTHAYEGGHPDHDAAAFAVQVACERLRREGRHAPVRIEFTSYHLAGQHLRTGDFLPDAGSEVRTLELTPAERAAKRRMLETLQTQREMLWRFSTAHERFRLAPDYDFTQPPHDGPMYYERYDWGIRGNAWRAAAAAALTGFTYHLPFSVTDERSSISGRRT